MLKSDNTATSKGEIRQAFLNDNEHELSGQNVEPSDLQVDFERDQWRVTHLPTGAQWSVNDANDDELCFEQVSEGEIDDWLAENHEHVYGEVEHARFTGNPHRKCQFPFCKHFSLDLSEDDEDED